MNGERRPRDGVAYIKVYDSFVKVFGEGGHEGGHRVFGHVAIREKFAERVDNLRFDVGGDKVGVVKERHRRLSHDVACGNGDIEKG